MKFTKITSEQAQELRDRHYNVFRKEGITFKCLKDSQPITATGFYFQNSTFDS